MSKTPSSITTLINVQFDITDTIISTDNIGVTLYVIEDSVVGSGIGFDQQNRTSLYGGVSPIVGFVHNRVLRAIYPDTNSFGDFSLIPTNPPVNSTYSKIITVTIDPNWNTSNLTYVAFASHKNGTSNYEVLNAEEIDDNGLLTSLRNHKTTDLANFNIYPNPATEILTIELKNENLSKLNYTIMDITGKRIIEKFESNPSYISTIDDSNLKKGIYFLQITSDQLQLTKKVIIQ